MTSVDTPGAGLLAFPIAGSTTSARRLELRLGAASQGAPGKANEDFYAVVAPSDADSAGRGMVLALADGVSAGGSGWAAAQSAVRSLTVDYYATPVHWSVGQSLDRLLRAANDWLWAQHGRWPDQDSVVAAVSMLVLRDERYYLAHVGDTRVYRLRGNIFQQLTTDHTWQRRDMRHVLRRAVGLDSHLVVDFAEGDLEEGDIFLMATDGVWEVLGDASMTEILRRRLEEPEAAASALVEAAHRHQAAYMGRNDATAVVFCIGRST
jgi:serine/threonine protein phosphatase PrpC